MKFIMVLVPVVIIGLLILSGCTGKAGLASNISSGTSAQDLESNSDKSIANTGSDSIEGTESNPSSPYQLVDGLHVTGTPIVVDIETYRLKIVSQVDNPLSLTFDEVKQMNSEREFIELVCPGFFVDEGYWTGVKVSDLLQMAKVKNGATKVLFTSIDGSYEKELPLEKLLGEGFLIAYQFNDKEFSDIHGYPLRLVAKDEPGSLWVKWLGEIKVL